MRDQIKWFAATMALFALVVASGEAGAHSRKKGIGLPFGKYPHFSAKVIRKLHVSWFYTWGDKIPSTAPAKLPFVPMIWGYYPKSLPAAIKMLTAYRRAGTVDAMLGFNEPDGRHQSNIPVARALKAWPLLESVGLPLGSPACAHPGGKWMREFMHGVRRHHYRVNFICIHWYGSPNPRAFLHMLAVMYHRYHRPLWITEFAIGDWGIKKNPHHLNKYSPAMVAGFMRAVLPVLNRLPYVKRYAWFPAPRSLTWPTGTSALYHKDGRLTKLGRIYAAD